jgi:type IV secretory pathway VirB2 component (pilin)
LAFPSRFTVAGLAAVLAGAILGPWYAGWVPSASLVALSALVAAAMVASCLREQARAAADRAMMPPAFIVVFTALMLLGGYVAMTIAVAAVLTAALMTERLSWRDLIVDVAIALAAFEAADLAHRWTSDVVPRAFVWPWMAIPIAVGVLAYHLAQGLIARVVVPSSPGARSNDGGSRVRSSGCRWPARRRRRRARRRNRRSPDVGSRRARRRRARVRVLDLRRLHAPRRGSAPAP